MNKKNWKLFGLSFSMTLLFFAFTAAFLLVDSGTSRRERGSNDQFFSITALSPHEREIQFFGRYALMDFQPLEQPTQIRRDYAPLLTPRALLTAEYAVDYATHWGNVFYDAYKERVFQREVAAFSGTDVEIEAEHPSETINGSAFSDEENEAGQFAEDSELSDSENEAVRSVEISTAEQPEVVE